MSAYIVRKSTRHAIFHSRRADDSQGPGARLNIDVLQKKKRQPAEVISVQMTEQDCIDSAPADRLCRFRDARIVGPQSSSSEPSGPSIRYAAMVPSAGTVTRLRFREK